MRISDWSSDVGSSDLDAETAVPKPEPAADLTPQSPAPRATAPVAEQTPGADDAQTPAEAGQAAVTDTPRTDAPDASADAATDAAAPAPSEVEAATEAPVAQPHAPAPAAATTTHAEGPAAASEAHTPASQS